MARRTPCGVRWIRTERCLRAKRRNGVMAVLRGQGYEVKDGEPIFESSCGSGKCRPDVIYRDASGRVRIIEVKTGDAGLSIRQSEIFPQIANGDAVPHGRTARELDLSSIPLREQGYPNGIPIETSRWPGLGQ